MEEHTRNTHADCYHIFKSEAKRIKYDTVIIERWREGERGVGTWELELKEVFLEMRRQFNY